MSPDQRWIVYRKAYPSQGTELPVSQEYLLYDLSKSPAQNRAPGVALDDNGDVGAPIYPLGQKNLPGDNIGVPDHQLHSMVSDFYWSPDSKALVFADLLLDKVSLVLVPFSGSVADGALVSPPERSLGVCRRLSGGQQCRVRTRTDNGPFDICQLCRRMHAATATAPSCRFRAGEGGGPHACDVYAQGDKGASVKASLSAGGTRVTCWIVAAERYSLPARERKSRLEEK